ncbi:hypothetical protein H3146_06715 [Streptomyces sp. OF3]|uniref:Uncharacterized protein n=1 Tax=Streptomyces alkaliterrae TaxID=2213162 RepID=A0A7W3ZM24_9ACTN|nr:hypothetical protein [Streptomyces alkaliterrae]MBB1253061.1 hypothetical protein [Streptomyces alkaliterrae]
MRLAATSTEFVPVDVTGPDDVDLASTTPRLAFLPQARQGNPEPDDWHVGVWHDGRILVLVGPEGGATTLAPGRYWVWVNVDPPGVEHVVTRAPRYLTIY